MKRQRRRGWQVLLALIAIGLASHGARGADGPPGNVGGQADPMAVPAKQWAQEASANEEKVLEDEHNYLRYRMHMVNARGDQVRDVIESRDGTVARLLLKENRPLTPEEDAAEQQRLQAMLDSPAAFARHVKNDKSGKKMAVDLIHQLPGAMIYTYAPGQPQRARNDARAGDPAEVVIDFKPDPAWSPPNMTAEALTGVEGRAWIDPRTMHMTRLEATIFRGINFGWGLFAHVYPGGTVTFEQTSVGEQRWIFTHFIEHVTVRAVMLKMINENSDVQGSNFTPVAAMSYQDAIHLLLASPLPTH